MDRPKHRSLVFLGFVLLAGAVLLLLDRQWLSAPDAAPIPSKPIAESRPEKVEPATIDIAARSELAPPPMPSSAPPATGTGFHGRIIDAVTREPVKEFEVRLIRVRREVQTEDPPIARSFKSATGHFSWDDVAAGTWRAAVAAPGYQMFNVDEFQVSTGTATGEVVTPLLRGFAVRGRVVELSTGAGIVDASIGFRRDGSDEFRRSRVAKSKEDGSFTLDGVPGGDVVLTVFALNHAQGELALVVNEKTPPQEIALSTGGTIAGTVMTTAGVPAKGTVYLAGPGPGYVIETNDLGQFSHAHQPAGRYRISADTSAGTARQEFVLGEDESREGIVLIVGGGRSVRGTIKGLRPDQLQRTYLALRTLSENASLAAQPDDRGAYAMKGVPPGRAVMHVHGPGIQFDKTVDVPADQDVTLDIVFPAGARLSGHITRGGKPIANKNVWMAPDEDKPGTLYQATTSAEGYYEIEWLPPGVYRLRADDDISRSVTMAGDAVLDIDIPSAQLSARVVEQGGAVPIIGAEVFVRGSSIETALVRGDKRTDDFGQVSFTGIEPGEIVLIVYKPGYEMHREKIAYSSPITGRTIGLRKSPGVEVRVQPGSLRFPAGFTITQSFPESQYTVDLWMPLDRAGVGHVPSALAGATLQIGRFSGKPIVIEDWDGQPFELP